MGAGRRGWRSLSGEGEQRLQLLSQPARGTSAGGLSQLKHQVNTWNLNNIKKTLLGDKLQNAIFCEAFVSHGRTRWSGQGKQMNIPDKHVNLRLDNPAIGTACQLLLSTTPDFALEYSS